MNMKLLAACALFLAILTAASCGTNADASRAGCKTRVGIVFDIGGKNDRSFNAAAWEGVKRAEKDLQRSACMTSNPATRLPSNRLCVLLPKSNFDLIVGIGFAQGPIMQSVATDYPDIKFAIIDGVIFEADGKTPKPNVASLVFREHEGSYPCWDDRRLESRRPGPC